MPSALSNSPESSSRDFSFIQSSIPGVVGNPMPSVLPDAFMRCAVTVTGESKSISSKGGAYGGGGALSRCSAAKVIEVDLRAFAGGSGRRGVAVAESLRGDNMMAPQTTVDEQQERGDVDVYRNGN